MAAGWTRPPDGLSRYFYSGANRSHFIPWRTVSADHARHESVWNSDTLKRRYDAGHRPVQGEAHSPLSSRRQPDQSRYAGAPSIPALERVQLGHRWKALT